MARERLFRPASYLSKSIGEPPKASTTALLILNQPIAHIALLDSLWHHSSYRLCADGGANRLYDLLKHSLDKYETTQAPPYLPTAIHGDLDSLAPHVRAFFSAHGVQVSQDPDQYSTDFGKALQHLRAQLPGLTDVLVLGSIAGRVDQGIGLLHEMGREANKHPGVRLWLFSEASVSFVLPRGSSVVETPGCWRGDAAPLPERNGEAAVVLSRNVGILPIYGPAVISTRGLEWDVKEWPTEMMGDVSTSNHIVDQQVEVCTDEMVLFTVERATDI